MKKMQGKSKIYNLQGKSTNSPSKQAIWMANTNFPPQISKLRRIKGFGEDVGQLSLGVYIPHLNVPLLYMISQKWFLLLTCLIFLWKTGFLATEMALVLSHMRGTLSNLTRKSLMVCTIQGIYEQQLAAATYLASVVDCATEDCFREDQQMREVLRK
jgi:hypothetical protein